MDATGPGHCQARGRPGRGKPNSATGPVLLPTGVIRSVGQLRLAADRPGRLCIPVHSSAAGPLPWHCWTCLDQRVGPHPRARQARPLAKSTPPKQRPGFSISTHHGLIRLPVTDPSGISRAAAGFFPSTESDASQGREI